jgi:hypothetical protein
MRTKRKSSIAPLHRNLPGVPHPFDVILYATGRPTRIMQSSQRWGVSILIPRKSRLDISRLQANGSIERGFFIAGGRIKELTVLHEFQSCRKPRFEQAHLVAQLSRNKC